jgi:inactive STAND/Caspase domain
MASYALVIGISRYDNFRHLDKAATDAAAIAQILQAQGQYQVEPLPKRLVEANNRWELATDKKLTAKDLGQSLETFLLERAKDQKALIYFAGHGFEVAGLGSKKKGYLATSDTTVDGCNAILFSDLNDLIRESSLSSLVVILDCCHAGSFLERTVLESTLTAVREKKDYYLITACRSFERAREGEEHGIFTAVVLKGLQPENADNEGIVTGDRLFDFIQKELRQSGQEPIRMGMGRSITLVSYPQPQTSTPTGARSQIAPDRYDSQHQEQALIRIKQDERLYQALLRLGYFEQTKLFRKFVRTYPITAFLIYGKLDYGQRWLLNRLVEKHTHDSIADAPIKINWSRISQRTDVTALWQALARRVGLSLPAKPQEIMNCIARRWQHQNIVLVFYEVDFLPKAFLEELLRDFWAPLATQAWNSARPQSPYKLLMFLVDYDGKVGEWSIPFAESLDPSWQPSTPVKLPIIEEFTEGDLLSWLQFSADDLPVDLIDEMDETVQAILENSNDGIPELTFWDICQRAGSNWYENEDKWMKL